MIEYKLFEYDGVNIPFNPEWDSIAISASGGADSTIIAYLLCDMISKLGCDTTIHIISHIRMWKSRPWQQYDSLKIFNELKRRFPSINMVRHTSFIAPDLEYGNIGASIKDEYGKMVSGDNIQKRSFAEFVCTSHNVKCHFNAVTKNPPNNMGRRMFERDVERTDKNSHLELMEHMGVLASHPLRFTDKSWVVKQYIDHDVLDLFDMTRSCESDFPGLDYTNYKPYQHVPVCGACFWCMEREWAKGVNGV